MEPNGKLFDEKLEEGNGGLGYRKTVMKREDRSQRDKEASRGDILRRKRGGGGDGVM